MDVQGLLGDQLANLMICLHENNIGLLYYLFEVTCSYFNKEFLRSELNSTYIVLDYHCSFCQFKERNNTFNFPPD